MDCAPLNLAHFHERRSERFMRHHCYEEAIKALETSLIYLQDAYKNVSMPKSREILDTLTLDFERKLRQIEMRKTQHGLNKMKDYAPLKEPSQLPAGAQSGQSVAKAIDKTVQEFDAKFTSTLSIKATANTVPQSEPQTESMSSSESQRDEQEQQLMELNGDPDLPSLTPLELPSFDYSLPASYAGLAESFQK